MGVATATETSTVLCCRMKTCPSGPSRQEELTMGTFLQATATALIMKSLRESLYSPFAEALRAARSFRSLETESVPETK